MSSTTSNNSSTASSSIISLHKFSHLITEPEMTRSLARAFASRPTSTAILRYYFFLSRSIVRLEQDLERHRHEQNTLFDHLFKSRRFLMKVEPIIQRYRQLTLRYHPLAILHLPLAGLQTTTTSICPRILPLMKKLDQNKTQSLSPTMKRPTLVHSKDRRPGDIVSPQYQIHVCTFL